MEEVSVEEFLALQKSNEALAERVSILEKMLTAKTEVNIGAKKELPTIPDALVSFGDKKYKWAVPMLVNPLGKMGEKITAEEAAHDEDIVAAILKINGQGLLVAVE